MVQWTFLTKELLEACRVSLDVEEVEDGGDGDADEEADAEHAEGPGSPVDAKGLDEAVHETHGRHEDVPVDEHLRGSRVR